jgi:hypothetical protein
MSTQIKDLEAERARHWAEFEKSSMEMRHVKQLKLDEFDEYVYICTILRSSHAALLEYVKCTERIIALNVEAKNFVVISALRSDLEAKKAIILEVVRAEVRNLTPIN